MTTEKLRARDVYRHGLAFPFTALREPLGEAFGEAFRNQPEAGFDFSISNRKRVVEIGRVGKVAHAELIQPFERAGPSFAANHDLDGEFLCLHEAKEAKSK